MKLGSKVRAFFGVDDDYERPTPARAWIFDTSLAIVFLAVAIPVLMANRSLPTLAELLPLAPSLAAFITAGILMALRRTFPITVMILMTVHFIVLGVNLPMVGSLLTIQIQYFIAMYTGVAYGKRRERVMISTIAIITAMTIWLIVSDLFLPSGNSPNLWYYLATVGLNIVYFAGTVHMGRQSYLQAKLEYELRESTEVVKQQSAQLADQAVLAERLRIARDLHDSVAHHISLIGVQTAAARRAMQKQPELSAEAMKEVEELSRNAVQELRDILGSLRDIEPSGESCLSSLEELCSDTSTANLHVTYDRVGDDDAFATLTPAQQSTLVRVAQEALTNVRRHSTASEARVVLRIHGATIELEITDNGMPIPGTTGSGLGQMGMRERVGALGGFLQTGPRATQGYRVHAVLPGRAS